MAKTIKRGISHNFSRAKGKKGPKAIEKVKVKKESKPSQAGNKQEDTSIIQKKVTKPIVSNVKAKTKPKGKKGAINKAKVKVKEEAKKMMKFVKGRINKSGPQVQNERKNNKGVVYLSHIPHGFYDDQIKDYFSQFGDVTGVNLPRSEKGKSRGYAFIEFRHADVAKVAAETMNNYLMMGRLLKAQYVPPENQKPYKFRTNLVTKQLAKEHRVNRSMKLRNRSLDKEGQEKFSTKLARKLNNIKKKLKEKGVNIDVQIGYESEALLTGLKTLDPDCPDTSKKPEPEVKKSPLMFKKPSKLDIAAEKVTKGTTSAIRKVQKMKKKLKAANEPKDSLRKISSLGGKIGKKVKKKVTKSGIKRVKLETDV